MDLFYFLHNDKYQKKKEIKTPLFGWELSGVAVSQFFRWISSIISPLSVHLFVGPAVSSPVCLSVKFFLD